MLEVHKEASPGEPMKPLSELVKEFRVQQISTEDYGLGAPAAHDCWKNAADLLQAWLREADELLDRDKTIRNREPDPMGEIYRGALSFCRNFIRSKLLGTTRTEGKK